MRAKSAASAEKVVSFCSRSEKAKYKQAHDLVVVAVAMLYIRIAQDEGWARRRENHESVVASMVEDSANIAAQLGCYYSCSSLEALSPHLSSNTMVCWSC